MFLHSILRAGAAVALAALVAASASAVESLPRPSGPVILSVAGSIERTTDGASADFDREQLEALGSVVVETRTPWYEGVSRFEGVPAAALMKHVGAAGKEVRAIALNDYEVRIPLADLARHGAILALKRDGEYMKVRDKGPVFVIYPFDSDEALRNETYYARSIWQLRTLRIE